MMLAENELPLFERPAAATVLDRGLSRCVYMEHCNRFKSSIRMKMLHINTSIRIKMPKPNEIVIGLRGVG